MSKFGVSQPVRRVEDARLITGSGRYTDDINLPGQVYGYVFRSPVARARITRLDVTAARAAPGVLTVLTGPDMEATGSNVVPCLVPMQNRDGSAGKEPKRPVLCVDAVQYVGDNIAFIVAETLAQAKDAAELIELDYDELDPVVATATAADPGQPQIYPDIPANLAFDWAFGDEAAVARTFAQAAHVTRLDLINNRVVVNSMEPRAAIAEFDATGKLTMHTGTQGGWGLKQYLAKQILKIPAQQVRIITPDVGGGFGMKSFNYPEHAMVALAARQLGRPVKWAGERSDAFVSDSMGRDHVTTAELAFDSAQQIIGMRVTTLANMGAYQSPFAPYIPTMAALKVLPGVYDVKQLYYRVKGVHTNTTPVDAYRGAGRPESIYVIERIIDLAARELGVDCTELRRKNFIPPEAMPFTTAVGEVYDTGEFARVMDKALEQADWAGFPARRAAAKQRNRLRGIGLCYYIESTMGPTQENAFIRFEPERMVSVFVGTQSNGQGHETAYTQIVSDRLGIPAEQIRIIQGDTDQIPKGGGTGGSRSVTAQGWALNEAADQVIAKGKQYAAQELEAATADIEFLEGRFQIAGTDRGIDIIDLALKAPTLDTPATGVSGGLDTKADINVGAWTFPNGCHIAEVEIDPDTGETFVVNYSVVDDFGKIINPLLVEGQVHGGVVQGLGQALMEQAVYNENGQLITGSFVDYCMPRADNMPLIRFSTVEVPCKNNPLGIKGCGEAGTVGSAGAVINAVIDALSEQGIDRIDMPATPQTVWQLLKRRVAA